MPLTAVCEEQNSSSKNTTRKRIVIRIQFKKRLSFPVPCFNFFIYWNPTKKYKRVSSCNACHEAFVSVEKDLICH